MSKEEQKKCNHLWEYFWTPIKQDGGDWHPKFPLYWITPFWICNKCKKLKREVDNSTNHSLNHR